MDETTTPTASQGGEPGRRRKVAVLSMDVEDWYHLDYFLGLPCDRSQSVLDGLDVFREQLDRLGVPATFFVVGELATRLRSPLQALASGRHEVAVHSWEHIRPLAQSPAAFAEGTRRARAALEDVLQAPVEGYRAPSYGIDRQRVDVLRELGFGYDSSRIQFAANRRYGQLDVAGFAEVRPGIFRQGDFFEFEVSTLPAMGKRIPVAGGGYFRLLPWWLMRGWVSRYIATHDYYVFYIHPYEFSAAPRLPVPPNVNWLYRFRYQHGRRGMPDRLTWLVRELRQHGFEFATFSQFKRQLADGPSPDLPPRTGP